MITQLKLLNKAIRPCFSQLTQFHIWASGPPADQSSTSAAPSSPSVLLFGFAGSSPHHLAKQAAVYTSLGYTSLACILPTQHLFYYNITQVGRQRAVGVHLYRI